MPKDIELLNNPAIVISTAPFNPKKIALANDSQEIGTKNIRSTAAAITKKVPKGNLLFLLESIFTILSLLNILKFNIRYKNIAKNSNMIPIFMYLFFLSNLFTSNPHTNYII